MEDILKEEQLETIVVAKKLKTDELYTLLDQSDNDPSNENLNNEIGEKRVSIKELLDKELEIYRDKLTILENQRQEGEHNPDLEGEISLINSHIYYLEGGETN